jgi:sugar phosphate isomerase/epimerase
MSISIRNSASKWASLFKLRTANHENRNTKPGLFPANIMEKFEYIKAMGFDGYEIDGKLLVENLDEVKAAIKATGLPVTTACGGYDGWIGDLSKSVV